MKNIPSLLNTLLNKAKSLVMEEINPDVTSSQSMQDINPGESTAESQPVVAAQPAPVKKITLIKGITAIFNGLGVGLLLGMLLALSLSPVVSGVIAALSGLLAILLGLDEKYIDPLKSLRIGAFGLFAVAGILIGLYIRANDPFAPSMLDKMNNYREIGFSDEEARAFITKSIESDTGKARREAGVLYSSTVDAGACDDLQYATSDQPVDEIINTFKTAGGTWKELAEAFAKSDIPGEFIGKSLIEMRDVFCNLQAEDGKIKMGNLNNVVGTDDSLDKIEKVLSSSGDSWKAIVNKISVNIPEKDRKDAYLCIVEVLTHK
jgi:hypothetical protein